MNPGASLNCQKGGKPPAPRREARSLSWIASTVLIVQIPSLRVFAKYLFVIHPWLPILFLAAEIGTLLLILGLQSQRIDACLRSRWLAVGLLLATVVLISVSYPIEQTRKAQKHGSDEDACLIQLANNLFSGHELYAINRSYGGNLCTTGPGIVLLDAPLVFTHLYPYGAPLVLAVVAWMLGAATKNFESANIFLLLFMSSLFSWEVMAEGSDLVVIGCGFVIAIVGAWEGLARGRAGFVLGAALFLGLLSSSRLPFLYLPLVLGLLIWQKDPRLAVKAVALGLAIGFGLAVGAYLWDPSKFSPLHALEKGQRMAGRNGELLGLAISVLAGLIAVWWARQSSLEAWLGVTCLLVVTPMAIAATAALIKVHLSLSAWDGATYLMAALPAFCAFAAVVMTRSSSQIGVMQT